MTVLDSKPITELQDVSFRVRKHILSLSGNGGCFIGASLSLVELLVYLYSEFLEIPEIKSHQRDYLFLSKGHDVPALYGLFAELGYFPASRLASHLSTEDSIYWHPNREIPGVEFHSGSLGHLLSIAMGVAYDLGICKSPRKVTVIVGDGELNEGSIWENLLVANALKLSNLYVVVDRNGYQANKATEDLLPLEPLEDKFRSFGCSPLTLDGHDFESLSLGFNRLATSSKVKVAIAKTVRGKGIPSIEGRVDRWFCNFSEEEIGRLGQELVTGVGLGVETEARTVR